MLGKNKILEFRQFLLKRQKEDLPFLVALSGGLDSVVLLHLCKAAGVPVVAAHMNFKLRGQESEGDAAFAKNLCQEWEIPFLYKEAPINLTQIAEENNRSLQMEARKIRYDWWKDLIRTKQVGFLLTGHHADDNLETVIHHLLRGSGIKGMAGIPEQRGRILRPLLTIPRADIYNYAKENKLSWRMDSSNLQSHYTRNYIRHEVIPLLRKMNPSLSETVARNSLRLRAETLFSQSWFIILNNKILSKREDGAVLANLEILKKLKGTLAYLEYWLAPYGFDYRQIQKIAHLDIHQTGKEFTAQEFRLVFDRQFLILEKALPKKRGPKTVINPDKEQSLSGEKGSLQFLTGILFFELTEGIKTGIQKSSLYAYINAEAFPNLKAGPWRTGDRMAPFGMKGKLKKISDLLTDAKIPTDLRRDIPVVRTETEILYLAGIRSSEKATIQPETSKVWVLRWEPNYENLRPKSAK